MIVDQIREAIEQADLVIAVCTGKNADVFYELRRRCHRYRLKRQTVKNLPDRPTGAMCETLTDPDRRRGPGVSQP
jgi:hypothetical protein